MGYTDNTQKEDAAPRSRAPPPVRVMPRSGLQPGYDIVVVARTRAIFGRYADLERSFRQLTRKLGLTLGAPAPAPAPAAEAAAEQPAPMVGMSDAVAVAEKEYKAKTYRANLRNSGQYGLVWDVHMVKEDETHVRAYVDAKTGKVVAADVKGIQERRPGRGMGPGPRPQCPVTGGAPGTNPDCPMAGGFRHPGFHGYHHW